MAITYLPVDRDGLINLAELHDTLRPETILITVMHANNELGTVQPLAKSASSPLKPMSISIPTQCNPLGKISVDVQVVQLGFAGTFRT